MLRVQPRPARYGLVPYTHVFIILRLEHVAGLIEQTLCVYYLTQIWSALWTGPELEFFFLGGHSSVFHMCGGALGRNNTYIARISIK